MRNFVSATIAVVLLAGCADLPRDPDGTLERVRREHRFAVGIVEGAVDPLGTRVLAGIAAATGARPEVQRGQLEPLLLELEEGRLDLVVGGRFAAETPWSTRVTLGKPVDRGEKDAPHRAHVAARNGENAWIMLVERTAREAGR